MRSIKGDEFEYKTFEDLLYDVRFELAKSRIMDTNIDKLQEHLIEEFTLYDKEKKGLITLMDAREVLLKSKKTNLTPFQVHILIGLSNPDNKGMIILKDFAFKCKEMINELFSMKSLNEKAMLLSSGTFMPPENLEEINLSKLDLFKVYFYNIYICSIVI
jgi:hypothetical protein